LINPIIKETLGAVVAANLKVPGLDREALLGGLKDSAAGLTEGAAGAAKDLKEKALDINPFKKK
jgi:hypothetical protein